MCCFAIIIVMYRTLGQKEYYTITIPSLDGNIQSPQLSYRKIRPARYKKRHKKNKSKRGKFTASNATKQKTENKNKNKTQN